MPRETDTRERLMQATIDLIWLRSYGAVSVDDICERSNVKKGSFYHFFKSKTDLVIASLDHYWQTQAKPGLDQVFSPVNSPAERFLQFLEGSYQKQSGYKAKFGQVLGCPLVSIGIETAESDRAISGKVRDLMSVHDRYVQSAVREWVAQQGGSSDDVATITQMIDAFFSGVMTQARIQNNPEVIRQSRAGLLRLLAMPLKSVA
jgi:TetR/AcrR family transcriptional regulator, transcriptional repressor for nem operon